MTPRRPLQRPSRILDSAGDPEHAEPTEGRHPMRIPGPTITLPATVFRTHLFILLDWIEAERGRVVVTLKGEQVAVLEWEDRWAPRHDGWRRRVRQRVVALVQRPGPPSRTPWKAGSDR